MPSNISLLNTVESTIFLQSAVGSSNRSRRRGLSHASHCPRDRAYNVFAIIKHLGMSDSIALTSMNA